MSPKGHAQVLGVATAVWAVFWAVGLPSYYQQYSRATMIGVCAILIPPIIAIAYVLLRPLPAGWRLSRALWLSFYFTVPLAVYDWLYCGVYLGYGTRFLSVFWYLTLFYIVPWILLPATAVVLDARAARSSRFPPRSKSPA